MEPMSAQERLPEPILGDRFVEAAGYAVELHARQARKGTAIPYVTHLFSVCSLALEDGADEDEAIAALLHDAAEDQGGQATLDEIGRRFGPVVAMLVDGLTDTLEDPKPDWRPRKEAYLKRLPGEPESVLRVSIADKLHNIRSIAIDVENNGEAAWERFNAGRDGQAWLHGSLLAIFETKLSRSRNLPEYRRLVQTVFGSEA
jgi:(p)ppGpp synthase/HD superfamily hydrolase